MDWNPPYTTYNNGFTPITLDNIRIANAEKASKYFQDLHKAFHSSASCKGAFTVCWKCVLIYSVCLFCLGFCLGFFSSFFVKLKHLFGCSSSSNHCLVFHSRLLASIFVVELFLFLSVNHRHSFLSYSGIFFCLGQVNPKSQALNWRNADRPALYWYFFALSHNIVLLPWIL